MERRPDDLFRVHDLSVLKSPLPAHLLKVPSTPLNNMNGASSNQGASKSPFAMPVRPTPKTGTTPFGLSSLAGSSLFHTPKTVPPSSSPNSLSNLVSTNKNQALTPSPGLFGPNTAGPVLPPKWSPLGLSKTHKSLISTELENISPQRSLNSNAVSSDSDNLTAISFNTEDASKNPSLGHVMVKEETLPKSSSKRLSTKPSNKVIKHETEIINSPRGTATNKKPESTCAEGIPALDKEETTNKEGTSKSKSDDPHFSLHGQARDKTIENSSVTPETKNERISASASTSGSSLPSISAAMAKATVPQSAVFLKPLAGNETNELGSPRDLNTAKVVESSSTVPSLAKKGPLAHAPLAKTPIERERGTKMAAGERMFEGKTNEITRVLDTTREGAPLESLKSPTPNGLVKRKDAPLSKKSQMQNASNAAANTGIFDSKSRSSSEIVLSSWSLVVVPNNPNVTKIEKSVTDEWIVLVGKRSDMSEMWHSSLITGRHSQREITTGSGRVYRLDGPADELALIEAGFSFETVEAFKDGFPEVWQSVLIQEFGEAKKEEALVAASECRESRGSPLKFKPTGGTRQSTSSAQASNQASDSKVEASGHDQEYIDTIETPPRGQDLEENKDTTDSLEPQKETEKDEVTELVASVTRLSAESLLPSKRSSNKRASVTPAKTKLGEVHTPVESKEEEAQTVAKKEASPSIIGRPPRSLKKETAAATSVVSDPPVKRTYAKHKRPLPTDLSTPQPDSSLKAKDTPIKKRGRRKSEADSLSRMNTSYTTVIGVDDVPEDVNVLGQTRSGRRVVAPLPYWENKYLRSVGVSSPLLFLKRSRRTPQTTTAESEPTLT